MSPSTLKQERIALHIHRTFGPAIVIPMTCREEAYTTADYILKKEEPDNQMHIMFDDILTKLVSGMCIGSTRYLQCIILMNVPIPYFYYPHMNTENLLGETSSKQTLIISRNSIPNVLDTRYEELPIISHGNLNTNSLLLTLDTEKELVEWWMGKDIPDWSSYPL